MELLQLKYFCHAAETQNFSKTAKYYMVPTSNISQSIKRLENELKKPLFTRSSNKIKLSENGLTFYKEVKKALDLIESATQNIKESSISETIKINISVNRRVVMRTIEKFQKCYPNIKFIVSHSVIENLSDYDIVITDKNFDTIYNKQEAIEEKLALAFNKNSFVFSKNPQIEELKKHSFITMQNNTSQYNFTLSVCNDLGFEPYIALQSDDPFYIRKCIELGLGIAIVPTISWRGQLAECIELKPIGNYTRKIYIYQKHGANQNLINFNNMLLSDFKALDI